jgi:membrane fusion protein (multidrug efflux system)
MKNISVIVCLASLLINFGCGHNEQKQEDEKFLVTSPIEQDTLVYKSYVCQIHSIQHIELRALEKGYLQNINVDEGQHVKKGQLLFQIMPVIYQAETQKAQAEVNFIEIEYQNTKKLADSNIVSRNELALAKAKLDKAKAELELANAHLGFTQISAAFDGIVGLFRARSGSLLDEGDLLTTLSDNNKMWVYFNVPETEYLAYIQSKAKHQDLPEVKLQMANNQMFDQTGIIETIEADFNNETGNIAFRATFQNPQGILRHGETGNVLMPIPLKDALIIPQKATFEVLEKKHVFVIDENNVAQSRQITVGMELPHLFVVTDGLKKGDKILLEGLRKVKNEQKISYDFVDPKKAISELDKLHAE